MQNREKNIMKICFLSRSFWPVESGAEKTVRELAEELAKRGHSVDVITTRNNNKLTKIEKLKGYRIIRLFWRKTKIRIIRIGVINYLFHDFLFLFQIGYLNLKNKYDVIICSRAISFGVPAVYIKKFFNIPLLLITAESNLDINKILRNKKSLKYKLFDYYKRKTKKFVVNNASKIILKVTDKKEFIKYFKVNEEKVISTTNPIKLNPRNNFDIKDDYKLKNIINYKFIILYTNKLNYIKGTDLLPEIVKILKYSISDFLLVICGRGNLSPNIKEEISEKKLEDNILFLGYRDDIDYLLSISDVVLKTDRGETCCGHSQIEAMAAGKPVIIGETKSQRNWFEHLYDIYFINERTPKNFADAILYLKNNNSIRHEIGNNAKKTIESNWSFEKFTDEFVKISNDLVNKKYK